MGVRVKTAGGVALIGLAALLAAFLVLTGTAHAADRVGGGGVVWGVGEDVYVAPGETVETVVVLGADARIAGRVRNSVIAVGGGVTVEPGASVGSGVTAADVTLLALGGRVTVAADAAHIGKTFQTSDPSGAVAGGVRHVFGAPFGADRAAGLVGWTLVNLILGLGVAALFPRQLAAIRDRVGARFWPSFGWGVLTAVVVVPLLTVAMIVSVIGLLLVVPWVAVVLPAAFAFGFLAAATLAGDRLLAALGGRRTLLTAVTVGVVLLSLVEIVPVLGGLVVGIASVAGFGALVVELKVRWQERRGRAPLGADPAAAVE